MKLLKGGNRIFYEMNVRLEWRESRWDTKEWRSGIAHLKKASEEEEIEAGTKAMGSESLPTSFPKKDRTYREDQNGNTIKL